MEGIVKVLCEPESVSIPEEYRNCSVDARQVDDALQHLSLRYAARTETEIVQPGDTVHCRAQRERYPDGRTVLLYTAVELPGAQQAAQAAVGKCVGDVFNAPLAGQDTTLTVEKIIRPVPVEVNDTLIASMGVQDVHTVADYRAYITEKMRQDRMTEQHKMAIRHVIAEMLNRSEIEYDAAQLEQELAQQAEAIRAEYLAYGMELSDEDIRNGFVEQVKQIVLAKELCARRGITIDRDEVENEADQMQEMMQLMGEEVPSREQLVEESMERAYVNALFSLIEAAVNEKMGG